MHHRHVTPGVVFVNGDPPKIIRSLLNLYSVIESLLTNCLQASAVSLVEAQNFECCYVSSCLKYDFEVTVCEGTKNRVNFPQNRQNNNQCSRPTSCEQLEKSGTGRVPLNVAQTWGGKKTKSKFFTRCDVVCSSGDKHLFLCAIVTQQESVSVKMKTEPSSLLFLSCAFRPDPGWNKDRKLLHAVNFSGGGGSSDRRNLRPQCV